MAKINLLFYHLLILGAVICFSTTSASEIEARKTHFRSLMLEYNWPVPDPNIIRFPHESSCHHFYLMLSEQDITLQECPEGQTFDYVNHKCSEEHVHCWSRRFGKLKHEALKHKKAL
ncbi:hypothetical protein CDAR_405751 [Caerostris darwini]|uniref:Chitin-binding type-2 domain-containing protein n=1 Tax=Caerostris darwini TaxID=1538125 RepID=A0AAV4X4S3_9ARAC|nr:hypothetical protein CDAR_405751 [Caerostris darwini]